MALPAGYALEGSPAESVKPKLPAGYKLETPLPLKGAGGIPRGASAVSLIKGAGRTGTGGAPIFPTTENQQKYPGLYGSPETGGVAGAPLRALASARSDIRLGLSPLSHPINTAKALYNLPFSVPPGEIIPKLAKLGKSAIETGTEAVKHPVETMKGLAETAIERPLSTLITLEAAGGMLKTAGEKVGSKILTAAGKGAQAIPEAAAGAVTTTAEKVTGALEKAFPLPTVTPYTETGLKAATKELRAVKDETLKKAIMPRTKDYGRTAVERKQFENSWDTGVEKIVENKSALQLTTKEGDIVNQLPQTVAQTEEAIYQTKKQIFPKYDAILKDADIQIPFDNTIRELKVITENPAMIAASPRTVEYAKKEIDRLSKLPPLTGSVAQDAVKLYNQRLDQYYETASYGESDIRHVDAVIANGLRNDLREAIGGLKGKQYDQFKKEYGALSDIEGAVNHRATVEARKKLKGLIDYADIATGAAAVESILSKSPVGLTASAAAKGITEYIKWKNKPDRMIRNMFERTERHMARQPIKKISEGAWAERDRQMAALNAKKNIQQ